MSGQKGRPMPTSLVMSPFGEFLGIEIESFGEGKALCSIAVKPHHFNAGGRVHGGVLTSLADSCAGVAVRSLRPEGVASATTDLNIAFIRPPMGDRLEAEAEVLHAGKRLYRVEMRVFSMTLGEQQARTLVAKCSATFMLVFPTNG
jgi:acyl-CoA thioesterase